MPPVIDAKIKAVQANPNITIKTGTVLARLGRPAG
jgi:hypothetical protein